MAKKKTKKTATESGSAESGEPTTAVARSDDEAVAAVRDIAEIAARLSQTDRRTLLDAARALETKGKIEKFNRELGVVAEKVAKRRRELSRPEYQVHIERTKDDFFIIQLDSARVFFNREELRAITRLCHAATGPADGARRMFKWFEKERSDLLADAGINSDRNPYLMALYDVVVSTYKLKES